MRSLAFDRPVEDVSPEAQSHWVTRLFLRAGGYYSKESVLLRGAKALYEGIQEQALDKRLLDGATIMHKPRAACSQLYNLHVCCGQPNACNRLPAADKA